MIALVLSVLLFGEFVRLPAANGAGPSGVISRVLDIATYSVWETSLGPLRWSSEVADTSLWEVGNLVRTDKPIVLIALEPPDQNLRSVGWRVASYYEPNHDIWVLSDSETQREARKTRGRRVMEILQGSLIVIPLPKGARILWLVNPDHEFLSEAKARLPVLLSRKYVMYTDLAPDAADFRIGSFVFRPS
jgi:hypothetical protein